MVNRCKWANDNPLMTEYHDAEWGVPVYDDRRLYEFLTLEGAQAGLSWLTILKKRGHYQKAFADFDCAKVARFNTRTVDRLCRYEGIVRNRMKIESTVNNAKMIVKLKSEHGSFNEYLWGFVDGRTIHGKWKSYLDIPAKTRGSMEMSKDLKKRGFKFVGPTICYALMQAVGMVNDHEAGCFRYEEIRSDGSLPGKSL
jgi:DNA-3-methyladenine glycosylase I